MDPEPSGFGRQSAGVLTSAVRKRTEGPIGAIESAWRRFTAA